MRREHGQRASACASICHQHAAGLRDERVAFGNARVATFEFVNVVIFIRETNRQSERDGNEIRQFAAMGCNALPIFRGGYFGKRGFQFIAAGKQLKIRLQSGGVFCEQR